MTIVRLRTQGKRLTKVRRWMCEIGGNCPPEGCWTIVQYVSPDFYRLVPRTGRVGAMPVGYGFDSIAATINTIVRIENKVASLEDAASLLKRREIIKKTDEEGIIATPANSCLNELVIEAARLSILNDGAWVKIVSGDNAHVEKR